jgi:hypothetical protein
MRKPGQFLLCVSAMMALALFISACSANIDGSGTGTSNLTVLQVMQKSTDAMKNLKSSHVNLQSTYSAQGNVSATATPGVTPTASGTPQSVSATVKGSGDQALPDQMQMDLTINQGITVSEILQGDNVYIKGTDGKWYVINKQSIQGTLANTFSNFSLNTNDLLGVLAHTQINDHGDESLNGQSLRHITATLDRDALKQLLENNPQLAGQFGQQNVDTVVNNLKSFNSSVDVWIDETTFYVHRTELKLNLMADTSQIGDGAPNTLSTNSDIIVDLSNFNETVTITPPTDATPITDPAAILGLK